jgi:hypothetical protein
MFQMKLQNEEVIGEEEASGCLRKNSKGLVVASEKIGRG